MATLTTRPSNNPSIFSRDHFSSFDMSDMREEDFFPYSLGTQEMQQNYSDLGQSTYDSYAPQPAYTFIGEAFYQTPHFVLDGPKDNIQMQYEQSTSPSVPSLVQSLDQVPSNLSHTSGASGPSTASSAVGSPYSQAAQSLSGHEQWLDHQGLGIDPTMDPDFTLPCQDIDLFSTYDGKFAGGFDPRLMFHDNVSHNPSAHQFPTPIPFSFGPPSPVPSNASSHSSYTPGLQQVASPHIPQSPYHQDYYGPQQARMHSQSPSLYSHDSPGSMTGFEMDPTETKGRCPNPDCGRLFKDLHAHMLTHQSERPEKCPIPTCEYHQKGFARKYDKNRHTLTHYKGTMVCGFCPHSGKASEKSFNRADVFKRHLTSVHGVEQAPPNSRKKSPGLSSSKKSTAASDDAAGKCSTCSTKFNNAQELYDHIDACLLTALGREDPSEAINEKLLTEVSNDKAVKETLERNMLPTGLENSASEDFEDDDDEDDAEGDATWTGASSGRSGKGSIPSAKRGSS